MGNKLKVGVFGACRGMTMIKVLAGHPDAVLTAVCDKHKELLEKVTKVAEENNIHVDVYSDFEEFFKCDMDAVVLANYANEHAPYAIRFLKSGRHVLSEVLPCETMAQAVELIEAVEESGKVYAYGENYCYMNHTFEMWRRYENGDVGEITYGEGEYVHDCSAIWPEITYGDKNHWRNRMHCGYYCTHSLGPVLMSTGKRPVQVVGFETPPHPAMIKLGACGGMASGCMLSVTLDNGALVKSLHGGLKKEPGSVSYQIYGTKGQIETARWDAPELPFHIYIEDEGHLCHGSTEHYDPKKFVDADLANASKQNTHGGSDFYSTHFFIQKILGRETGMKYSIDVYEAVDMGICGILGYRSILNGNVPVKVPNLRNKEERDAYRNDNACTNSAIAGDQLLPVSSFGDADIPDEVYAYVKDLYEKGERAK